MHQLDGQRLRDIYILHLIFGVVAALLKATELDYWTELSAALVGNHARQPCCGNIPLSSVAEPPSRTYLAYTLVQC